MHPDEVEVDTQLVRPLLESQFPQWADLPLARVVSAGTDNALFRLGPELVVRLPRISWAVDDVEKECRWLPRLAAHLPVAVPAPVAQGDPAGYPHRWWVYRWLEGVNPRVDQQPPRLAEQLGHFVNALRAVDATGAPLASRGVPLVDPAQRRDRLRLPRRRGTRPATSSSRGTS